MKPIIRKHIEILLKQPNRLTVLIKPPMGYVVALQKAYNTHVSFTKRVKQRNSRADLGCTRLQMALLFICSTGRSCMMHKY